MYSVSETTGKSLAGVVKDVLLRLNLPRHGLRGQTYDGAANMAGKHAGAQALIKQEQPLALYVHCGAHCTNLITQKACLASVLIRDSLDWVNQLGVLLSHSGKFKAIHAANPSCTAIKPLCPTRWTVRGKAITAVLSQYGSVLASLQEMACGTSNTASTANGLLGQFRKGKTVLGLILASAVICELECLNISFQKRTETIAGMRAAVQVVRTSLKAERDEASLKTLFEQATAVVQSLVFVNPITIPQTRPPPKCLIEGAEEHQPKSAKDHNRGEFFKVLDIVDAQLSELFNQDDLLTLQKLEETRSTMTQNRLTHVAVCHVHQDRLDLLDNKSICKQFVAANDRRKKHFGSFA